MNIKLADQTTQRIGYIDSLRGLAILLVIYSHICTFVFSIDTGISRLLNEIQLPLFFFISGFLDYSRQPCRSSIRRKFKNRFTKLLIPSFFTGGLFVCYSMADPLEALCSPSKYGYWFTLVLFEIFFLNLLILYLVDLFKVRRIALVYFCLIPFMLFLNHLPYEYGFYHAFWYDLLSFEFVLYYSSFFFVGIFCRINEARFLKLMDTPYFPSLLLILFVLLHLSGVASTCERFLVGVLGTVFIFNIFHYYATFFSETNKVGRIACYIGRKTLPIYLLHYFFINGIVMQAGYGTFLQANWVVELTLCLLLSAVVVALSLVTERIIQSFGLLNYLLLGAHSKKNK